MTLSGSEPELETGASGDWVTLLQTRLTGLRLFTDSIDGTFGPSTADAVRVLQGSRNLVESGAVDAATWAAITAAENDAGISHQQLEPGAGAEIPAGTLSEDQQWRWDGDGWQPNTAFEPPPATSPDGPAVDGGGQVSADGHWLWDGTSWQPVDQ